MTRYCYKGQHRADFNEFTEDPRKQMCDDCLKKYARIYEADYQFHLRKLAEAV